MTILYCNAKEHTIEDDKGNPITPEQAIQIVTDGQLEDCNLSFQRLINYDMDWSRLDKFYQENP